MTDDVFTMIVWGLYAAAAGRLIACDSVLTPARNWWLIRIGQLRDTPSRKQWERNPDAWTADVADVGAVIAAEGVGNLTWDDGSTFWASSVRRAWVVDGLTCPHCVAFHVLWLTAALSWVFTDGLEPHLLVWLGAAWQVAQTAIKYRNA